MKDKRGRLSSFDLLPEDAHPHIREALDALAKRERTQEDIRNEFNLHLSALGYDPVSRSAFNRRSLSLAKIGEEIRIAREMAAIFAEKLDDMPEGDVGMLIGETLKVIIYNMSQDIAGRDLEVSAKMIKELSLSLQRLEAAGTMSVKRRRQIEERVQKDATEVIETVAKERGMSLEVEQDIKTRILGLKKA
jgi:uncharacterized NAD(P)/FAD-binding protein YdhS